MRLMPTLRPVEALTGGSNESDLLKLGVAKSMSSLWI